MTLEWIKDGPEGALIVNRLEGIEVGIHVNDVTEFRRERLADTDHVAGYLAVRSPARRERKELKVRTWKDDSYMVRRGVAAGKQGKTYHLTEAIQGRYHYVYGPYAQPVLRIKPGDVVVAETLDAFEGKLKLESDSPTRLLERV